MYMVANILMGLTILLALALVGVTLSLNTKSEGLGAAITGASDSYRGAVGVEEQKRNLLKNLCYAFMFVALAYGVLIQYT
jgi:preprotein translocase subunit SecG